MYLFNQEVTSQPTH